MVRTLIVGTGDHAYGLAHLFSISNSATSGNFLEVTKPSITKKGPTFHDTGVPVVPFEEGLSCADIVILAFPASGIKRFMSIYIHFLKDKIIVDATNSTIPGEDLHSILAMTGVRWVKAFNDVGAVDVLLKKPDNKYQMVTKMCSSHADAVETLKVFAEDSMGFKVKVVPYEKYNGIADHQNSLGEDWMTAGTIMLIIFVLCEIYSVMRYNVHKGYAWFHLPLQVTNKAICWTALTGFSISQLPGVFARMSNALYANSLRTKPIWLTRFLAIRKHLGLVSLWFLSLHIIMSLLLFNPGYYGKFFITKDGTSKLNSIGENSFLFATIGTGLYVILGICSLPSVGAQMTNRQWQMVYGPVAWFALACGTIHVLVMGVKGWNDQEGWPGNLPPITLTATMVPLATIFLKLMQIVVCRVAWTLNTAVSKKGSGSDGTPSVFYPDDMESITSQRSARAGAMVAVPPLLNERKSPTKGSEPDYEEEETLDYVPYPKKFRSIKKSKQQIHEDVA
jgi:predicted dinucleotide-binding enzyme